MRVIITIVLPCNFTYGTSGMSVSMCGVNGNTYTQQRRRRDDGVQLKLA